ncbi:MAG: type II toxin-antitoxin system RelE/ParE family toxin [Bacteroidetes bacterium]|nr:type II toxin-antitoxin system RelE/ParE family toxin [Bacteroidota bacterium]
MNFQILYTRAAKRSITKLQPDEQDQVNSAIDNMLLYFASKHNNPPDVKTLKGKYHGVRRLRTGDFRILFKMEKGRLVILIIDVVKRKDAYKN